MGVRDTSAFSPLMRRARVLYELAVELELLTEEECEATLQRYCDILEDMPSLGFLDWAFIFHELTPPEVDEVATLFEETPLSCADCGEVFFGVHVDLMDDGLPCPNCGLGNVSRAKDISEWRARVLPPQTTVDGVPISPIPGRALADDLPAAPDEPTFDDFAKGLEAGMRVGSCLVEAFVARGGMGMVYRGHHINSGATVALKVLHTRLTHNETLIMRFREEARALSNLKSPHIVEVLEHGEVAKHGYLILEWLDGESLAQRMQRLGQVSVADTLDAGVQTCRALEVAHAQGIIHRDVKPDNILLMPDGVVKLVDFGLSKNTRTDMRLSQAGTYVGTPAYLAPEQLGSEVTPLADVYALACSLFHVLTGWLPFQGQDTAEVLQQHLQDPFPRASEYNRRVPPKLDELLMRMGQKKPSRRPQSVGEVAEAMARLREALDRRPAKEVRQRKETAATARMATADEVAGEPAKPAPQPAQPRKTTARTRRSPATNDIGRERRHPTTARPKPKARAATAERLTAKSRTKTAPIRRRTATKHTTTNKRLRTTSPATPPRTQPNKLAIASAVVAACTAIALLAWLFTA